jgi:hypothetical protein
VLLHRLVDSMSVGVVGSVTHTSALIDSATTSPTSNLGPHFAPSLGTYPWYHDSGASFHMTPHSAHLSSLHHSYHRCIVHTADGSPLCIAGQGTLSSNSFHVPDVSLVPDLSMHLMSTGHITDHDCRVILDFDVCYIQDHHTRHLVGTSSRCYLSQCLWELDWLRLPSAMPASLARSSYAALSMSSFAQWHHRPGHPCGSQLYLHCFVEVF